MRFVFKRLIDLNTISVSLKVASSVDIPYLKPYCSVTYVASMQLLA
jgi:hypothetical protein